MRKSVLWLTLGRIVQKQFCFFEHKDPLLPNVQALSLGVVLDNAGVVNKMGWVAVLSWLARFAGWLVGWFAGGWLVGWLVGWLCFLFYFPTEFSCFWDLSEVSSTFELQCFHENHKDP